MKENVKKNRCQSIGRTVVLSVLLLLVFAKSVRAAAPEIYAESAILLNAKTGNVLYEKNADTRRAPASLTKMMTCILCLETKGMDATFRISQAAAKTEDSYLQMKADEKLLSGELMREMMMESDNGAAVAVAQNVSGTVLKFAERMNAKAKELGCTRTHFSNPNGLTAKWHYSTARDLSKIAAYCMKNPDFRNLVKNRKGVIRWVKPSGRTYNSETTNELLGRYDGANGIKTGWTNAAKGCLAASARRGDVELIAIVLKSKDHDTRFTDAQQLLDYGFSIGGEGKTVVADTVSSVKNNWSTTAKPGNVTKPETKTPVVSTSPVTKTSAPTIKSTEEKNQSTVSSDTKITSSVTQASEVTPVKSSNHTISNKPAPKTAGVQMPVVRKPGA